MRRLLVSLTAIISMVACKNDSTTNNVIISGSIDNPMVDAIIIKGHQLNKTININADGTFKETLEIASSGYYNVIHARESTPVFLNSGDDVIVNFDASQFGSTIKFAGKSANVNNYLVAKMRFQKNNAEDVPMLYSMEQTDFLQSINRLKNKSDAFLNDATNLADDFIALEKNSINFDYLAKLQLYPNYHTYFTKKDTIQVSSAFKTPFEDFDYGNETNYKNFSSYKGLVINHYSQAILDEGRTNAVFDELKALKSSIIKEDIAKALSKNIALAYENNEVVYNGIMAISSDPAFKNKLTATYNKVKKLAKGTPSPKFTSYENHKGGKTSLEDLKGAFVYIDIWATWCAPCIREIPFLKDLEKAYDGKNIQFVSLSIDRANDYDTWFKMVEDKKLGGIQILADSDWQSQFIKDYNIIGIPRFIIVDPNGNIISADAPRPSDPKLLELFNTLDI